MTKSLLEVLICVFFIRLLTNFSNPIVGILVGVGFTAIIQSASAAVGILQALSSTGAITFSIALPVLMGIAIGASVPVVLSSIGTKTDAIRNAWSYLIIDIVGSIVVSILYYGLNAVIHFSFVNIELNTVSIALVNTLIRVLMIAILAPFINKLVIVMKALIVSEEEEEQADVDRLEDKFLMYPSVALEQAREVINKMAETTKRI